MIPSLGGTGLIVAQALFQMRVETPGGGSGNMAGAFDEIKGVIQRGLTKRLNRPARQSDLFKALANLIHILIKRNHRHRRIKCLTA